jgi:hypothetical protein
MKSKTRNALIVTFVGASLLPFDSLGQGSFQNLNFEQAQIVPIPGDPYNRVQFNSAIPSWTGRVGTNVQTRALYNGVFLDSTGIGIHDSGSPLAPLAGSYSALIQARWGLALDGYPDFTPVDASLSQTGLVPINAQSLQFRGKGGNFQVSLNGQTLSLTPVIDTSSYTLYRADVTPFAGTVNELNFTVFSAGSLCLDAIQFSTQAIPEPTTLALTGIGALLFGVFYRRNSRRK